MDNTATLTWFSGNYGSIMQAFALQNKIIELGYNNHIINYVPDKIEKLAFFCNSSARFVTLNNKIESRKIQSKFLSAKEIKEKNDKFNKFYEESFILTKQISRQKDMDSLNDEYNTFLCGSDQIWNPNYFKECNFLNFVSDSAKRIAYAPSVGTTQLTEKERNRIKPYLKHFDRISVREESSKKLIQDIVDEPVQVVCDPVFLLSKEMWIKKMQLTEANEKYILCYFLGDNPQYKKVVEYLKETLKINVKIIPTNTFGYEMGFDIEKTVGPKDWINLLYGAEFVLTDSFHATAFSVIFNKDFYVLKRFADTSSKSQNSRIYHLLDMTGLRSRIWEDDNYSNIGCIQKELWEKVNQRVSEQRNLSSAWLEKSLSDKTDN